MPPAGFEPATPSLGGPALTQAGDPFAVEFKDGDLPHQLAAALDEVVEVGFPLGDGGGAFEVEAERFGLDLGLFFDDLGLLVVGDSGLVTDRFLQYMLVLGGGGGKDGEGQIRVLGGPCAQIGVDDFALMALDKLIGPPLPCQARLVDQIGCGGQGPRKVSVARAVLPRSGRHCWRRSRRPWTAHFRTIDISTPINRARTMPGTSDGAQ